MNANPIKLMCQPYFRPIFALFSPPTGPLDRLFQRLSDEFPVADAQPEVVAAVILLQEVVAPLGTWLAEQAWPFAIME